MVEWVVWIWFVEQINETVNDGINVQDWLPIFSQDIETDLAVQVNIGVVDFGHAINLGWGMGIMLWNLELKVVGCRCPKPSIGRDGNQEKGQIVRVWEIDVGNPTAVELGNV